LLPLYLVREGEHLYGLIPHFLPRCAREDLILYTRRVPRPGGMLSDVRSQDFHNWLIVMWGVLGNLFEGIDASEANLKLLTSCSIGRS
jgi:hypothetical protein